MAPGRVRPLNDYSATVIGIVRDETDYREILSATSSTAAGSRAFLPTRPVTIATTRHWRHRAATWAILRCLCATARAR